MSGTGITLTQKGSANLTTGICRLSHPVLMEPRGIRADPNSAPKFSASLIFDPADTVDIWAAMVAVANARWQPMKLADGTILNGEGMLRSAMLHSPLRAGTERPTDPAYLGKFFINASATPKSPPQLLDYDGDTLLAPSVFYAGCYVRASITVFHFDKGVNKGLGIGLNALQWVDHGERIDGRESAKAAFAKAPPLPPRSAPEPGYGYNGGAPAPSGGGQPPASWQGAQPTPAPAAPGYAAPPQPAPAPQYAQQPPQYAPQPPMQNAAPAPVANANYMPPQPARQGPALPPGVS